MSDLKLSSYIQPSLNTESILPWTISTLYQTDQFVYFGNTLCKCISAHTSSSTNFITDYQGGKWVNVNPIPLTNAQRLAITSLFEGQQVYQTDGDIGLWIYNDGYWEQISNNEWKSYTPTISAVTTNPNLGTGYNLKASYRIVGKIMYIRFYLVAGTGYSQGVGDYRISIPSSYTIDYTNINYGATNGATNTSLGHAFTCQTDGKYGANGKVVGIDNTKLALYFAKPWETYTPSAFWSSTFHGVVAPTTFTAEIPIL